jgi:hypothetical protein
MFADSSKGQSYYKDVDLVKVTVNYSDHMVITWLRPVKRQVFARPDKNYYWYSANHIHNTQGGFSGKLINGMYNDYYSNKNLKEQGRFLNGLKTGVWKTWSPEGRLQLVTEWNGGQQSGRYFRYDQQGVLKENGRYKNGSPDGKTITHITPDSTVTTRYKEGKVVTITKKKKIPSFISMIFKKRVKAVK